MAVFQAFLTWLGRSAGKVLNAIFGWAVVALFGRTSERQQTLLSVLVGMALLWPLLLVGIPFPRIATFLIAFVPVVHSAPTAALRVLWIVLTVIVPMIVGFVVATRRAPGVRAEPFVQRVLRGYPVTIALAAAFLLMFVVVPVLRVASALQKRSDEHVPLITEGDEYARAVDVLSHVIERFGLDARRARPPWWMSVPSAILAKLGGRAFGAYMPKEFAFWRGPTLQIGLYPGDILVRGPKATAAWTHGLLAESFARGPGLQSADPEVQDIERETQSVWKVLDELPAAHVGSPVLLGRLQEIARELGRREVPYDDWQIAYRKIAQLGRALHGESQLLESAASKERGGRVMANERSRPEITGERPLQGTPTGELLGQLFRQTSDLLKKELELVRLESRESIQSAISMTIEMASAALFGLVALGCFAACIVLALSKVLDPWVAALITGGIMLVISIGLVVFARASHKGRPYHRTQKTLKEDVQWAKERAA